MPPRIFLHSLAFLCEVPLPQRHFESRPNGLRHAKERLGRKSTAEMSRHAVHGTRNVCRQTLARSFPVQSLRPLAIPSANLAQRQLHRRTCLRIERRNYATASTLPQIAPEEEDPYAAQRRPLPDLTKLSSVVEQTRNRFLSMGGIPASQLTLVALKTCQTAAAAIKPHLNRRDFRPPSSGATNNLLALDSNGSKAKAKAQALEKETANIKDTVRKISQAAYDMVASPNVILTTEILDLYVDIQSKLAQPSSIPDVFELFATKPQPKKSGEAVTYKKVNANRASAAIDLEVADKALSAAMAAKDLDAAIGIVEACYTGKPFLKQKLLKAASLPAILTVATPFAAYTIAHQFAVAHYNVDPATATKITFAAGMAYVIFTGSLGLIAKATVADHMVRVTWANGMPLRDRWLREEEREALDKIAQAWGFRETWRHGEEGGTEWACLREYIGQKGMVLDRVEFMEGMNA